MCSGVWKNLPTFSGSWKYLYCFLYARSGSSLSCSHFAFMRWFRDVVSPARNALFCCSSAIFSFYRYMFASISPRPLSFLLNLGSWRAFPKPKKAASFPKVSGPWWPTGALGSCCCFEDLIDFTPFCLSFSRCFFSLYVLFLRNLPAAVSAFEATEAFAFTFQTFFSCTSFSRSVITFECIIAFFSSFLRSRLTSPTDLPDDITYLASDVMDISDFRDLPDLPDFFALDWAIPLLLHID